MNAVLGLLTAILTLTPATGPHNASDGQLELYYQLLKGAPPVAYWDAVAKCETGQNWRNGGRFAGGLGIMNQGRREGTWERWGGEQFAASPDRATRVQQLVIANRIALFGWQTLDSFRTYDDKINNRPMFKHPVGFYGWGCIKTVVGNPCGKLKDKTFGSWKPPRSYAVVHCRK